MAKELSRTFDLPAGAVYLVIQDMYGNLSHHTFYMAGVPDLDSAVTQLLTDTDAQATVIRERMIAAGFSPQ